MCDHPLHLGCGRNVAPPPGLTRRRLLEFAGAGMAIGALAGAFPIAPARAQTPAAGRILLKGGTVLSMDRAVGDFRVGDVLIEGERIAAVGPNLAADGAQVIDAANTVVLPGFVDTHRHLWQGIVRNVLPDATLGEYFRNVLLKMGPVFRPEDAYAGDLISCWSALDAGVTTVLDWSHIQTTPEHTDAVVQALRETGIRAVFGYGGPQVGKPWWTDQSHKYPGDIARVRRQYFSSADQLVTLALCPSGPNTAPMDVAAREWQAARDAGARISVHIGTGPQGGGKLEQFAREKNMLGADTTYIHCTSLNDQEWKLIADSGGSVSIATMVEMEMGHGMPPIQKALDSGIRPSLSVDVETSIPNEMFTQMRITMALQRALIHQRAFRGEKELPKLLSARDVLEFATIDGARACKLDDRIGSLTPGKQADIVMLRTDRINVAPVNDPVGAIVGGMDTGNVDSVFVAGKARKRNGRLLDVDLVRVADLAAKSREYVIGKAPPG